MKRRLARGIGAMAALRFHRRTLGALRPVARDPRWRCVLAVTPDHARADWGRLLPRGVARIAQGRGDLGQRLQRATARYRRVVVIGSDIPGLRPADVAAAFRAIGRGPVFGPAADGGYWLVGLGPLRPARVFARVRWSGPHALADTLANCRGRRVTLLRELRDVDEAADLAALGMAA